MDLGERNIALSDSEAPMALERFFSGLSLLSKKMFYLKMTPFLAFYLLVSKPRVPSSFVSRHQEENFKMFSVPSYKPMFMRLKMGAEMSP